MLGKEDKHDKYKAMLGKEDKHVKYKAINSGKTKMASVFHIPGKELYKHLIQFCEI